MCEQSDHQPAVLRELVERVQRIDVIGTPEWTANSSLRGLAQMEVVLAPRADRPQPPATWDRRRPDHAEVNFRPRDLGPSCDRWPSLSAP